MHFISFGFLLATTYVWVWMVCSLHSVTTGSRDRANVSLIIIITILYTVHILEEDEGVSSKKDHLVRLHETPPTLARTEKKKL